MIYFTQDFIDFYIELSRNNNKEWFYANKQRFETNVREPFMQLIQDVINEIGKYESLDITPKDCVYRYNRDIRFSKEKHPYKMHISGAISSMGRKDHGFPGIFLRLSPEDVGILGGSYSIEKENLLKIREAIAKNTGEFKKLYTDKKFVEIYGQLQGTEIKRISKEFKEAFAKEPLIARKQFYYTSTYSENLITSDKLFDTIIDHYHIGKPINDFIKKALK